MTDQLALDPNVITARLVYDGAQVVTVPKECGEPRKDPNPQMVGQPGENLCELAGRICYDSLGGEKTRGTADYHKHILDVGHLSVYEHYNITVGFNPEDAMTMPTAVMLLNRPGLWSTYGGPKQGWRVTLNARAVLEWDAWSQTLPAHPFLKDTAQFVGEAIRHLFHKQMPLVIRAPLEPAMIPVQRLMPQTNDERWISLYLAGGRGFSHEQCRHGDFSGISQRSSRFCNESESPWSEHPLITAYLADMDKRSALALAATADDMAKAEREANERAVAFPPIETPPSELLLSIGAMHAASEFRRRSASVMLHARQAYDAGVKELQPWLVERKVDATTARKQARGAGRGYLGNALATEMLFSASVAQWLRQIKQRGGQAADGEIRQVYVKALPELQRSRYGKAFMHLVLADAPDGTGQCIVDVNATK